MLNLDKGAAPRPARESRVKETLRRRQHLGTGISWGRGQIGIEGIEDGIKNYLCL